MSSNKRTIPEIRERLLVIAEENDIPEIRDLVKEMYRKAPVRRAPVTSPSLTPELALKIRKYARMNPGMHFSVIASKFGVNPDRVSEAMNNLM